MTNLIELAERVRPKRQKSVLEALHNNNGTFATSKASLIEAAYCLKESNKVNLSIKRQDYSNTYVIKVLG